MNYSREDEDNSMLMEVKQKLAEVEERLAHHERVVRKHEAEVKKLKEVLKAQKEVIKNCEARNAERAKEGNEVVGQEIFQVDRIEASFEVPHEAPTRTPKKEENVSENMDTPTLVQLGGLWITPELRNIFIKNGVTPDVQKSKYNDIKIRLPADRYKKFIGNMKAKNCPKALITNTEFWILGNQQAPDLYVDVSPAVLYRLVMLSELGTKFFVKIHNKKFHKELTKKVE